MQGLMQDDPLTLPHLFDRAERLFPEEGDRHRDGHRASSGAPTASGPSAPAGSAACSTTSASRADGRVATFAWNTARHLELYFAAPCTRPGAAHAQHPAVPRAAHLHREPRRGRGDLRRPVARSACCGRCSPPSRPYATSWSWTTAAARSPSPDGGRRIHDYEELLAAAEPGRVARRPTRTRPRRCATRAAPPATPRASSTATARPCLHTMACHDRRQPRRPRARHDPAGRADVPRQRLGPGPRRGGRRAPTWSCPGPTCRPPAIADADRAARRSPSPPACPPSGWACCPSSKGRDISALRAHPLRRLGRAQGAVGGLPRADRPADPPGLGHDRDQPGRPSIGHIKSHLADALGEDELADLPRRRRASPSLGVELPRRRPRHRSSRVPWDGESRGRAAGRRARGSPASTTTTTARPSRSPPTAGCAPATSPPSTPRATSASSTAPRTW